MKGISYMLTAVVVLSGAILYIGHASAQAGGEAVPIFGIKIPPGYRDWRVITVAHEEGNNNDLRAVLGNDIAIKAYREGKLPFPDGSMIARLAWSYVPSEENNKSLAVLNLSWLDPPRTFSLWSRTRKNMPRPEAGGLLNSKTANRPTRRCSKPAFPATSLLELVTSSLPITHLKYGDVPWTRKNHLAIRLAKIR